MSDSKINNAGYRFVELLKELVKRPLSVDELLVIVEETSDSSYRKELVNKYLNTLKLLNISTVKYKDKYSIQKSLETIDFEYIDLSLIKFLQNSIQNLPTQQLKDEIFAALQVMEKNFSDNTAAIIAEKEIKPYKSNFKMIFDDTEIKKYEKYCRDKFKMSIKYKNDLTGNIDNYKIAPLKMIYKKGNAALIGYCYSTNSYKELLLENIIEVKQMPQISTVNLSGSVTFKLKNRLASSYKLKEGEIVIEQGLDYKIISNSLEDKDLILKRLIRYFDSCEILYPRTIKEKMLTLVEEMERIYV